MHYNTITFVLGLSQLLVPALTNPVPYNNGGCFLKPTYKIDKQYESEGKAVTGSQTCDANGEKCDLGASSSYATGTSVSVGSSLNLDLGGIANVGLDVSVSTSKDESFSTSGTKGCPKGKYWCALKIWPATWTVEGKKVEYRGTTCEPVEKKFTVSYPRKFQEANGSRYTVCACKNLEGWANKGAASIVCPEKCA